MQMTRKVIWLIVFAAFGSPAASQTHDTADIELRLGSYLAGTQPVSCDDGKRHLEDLGLRQVETVSCQNQVYTYRFVRAGARYEIQINGSDGRVIRRTSF